MKIHYTYNVLNWYTFLVSVLILTASATKKSIYLPKLYYSGQEWYEQILGSCFVPLLVSQKIQINLKLYCVQTILGFPLIQTIKE